jgi:iron complex transport system permease protein
MALGAAAVVAAGLGIFEGPSRVPVGQVVSAVLGRDAPEGALRIVTEVRLPRTIMGACVGALLATAGVIMQGFLRNPLAEPYLLGVSSGAILAVSLVVALGLPMMVCGIYILPFAAFAGAVLALVGVYLLAQARGRLNVTTLVLAGVVVSAFLSAVVMLIASLSRDRYFEIMAWLMGNLQPLSRGTEAWTAGYAVAGFALAWSQARDLNALLLGEEEAASLGVRVEATKRLLFVLSALLTGVAVSVSGMIGFVGLVAPHFARLLLGPDHRRLIPGAALAGAAMVMLADLAGRVVVAPAELPVGTVTALVGGPFFLFLLLRHAREVSGRRR